MQRMTRWLASPAKVGMEMLDRYMPEEEGGPFVETSAQTEFATDSDAPNIEGATREPFPTT